MQGPSIGPHQKQYATTNCIASNHYCSQLAACLGFTTPAAPIKWVGYDMSAYSVAKTLILIQMLQQRASTDDILLVWYSATWTKKAELAFRAAVKAALASLAGSEGKACLYLKHWLVASVSLADARTEWLASMDPGSCFAYGPASLKLRADRMALCRYLVCCSVCKYGTVCGKTAVCKGIQYLSTVLCQGASSHL
jgi:hypothetical protein